MSSVPHTKSTKRVKSRSVLAAAAAARFEPRTDSPSAGPLPLQRSRRGSRKRARSASLSPAADSGDGAAASARPTVHKKARMAATASFASPAPSPAAAPAHRRVWVKREGASAWVEVLIHASASLAAVVEAAVAKLPSLRDVDLDSLTLHVAPPATGTMLGEALDSTHSVGDAVPLEARVVIKRTDTARGAATHSLFEPHAADGLARLAIGMRAAQESTDGTTITLPTGIMWPDLQSNVLYVRHFYRELWEDVLNAGLCELPRLTGAVILGTPGIGKSAFGLYALYRALQAQRTVVYHARKGGFAVFKNNKAYKMAPVVDVSLLTELTDPTTLYISDSIPPVSFNGAFPLLITSPKRLNWSEFSKSEGVLKLVLPVFSEAEIMDLRRHAFLGRAACDVKAVQQRFDLWGGNARNVLTHGSDDTWQEELRNAASGLSLAAMENALKVTASLDSAAADPNVHRLLDLVPKGALPGSILLPSDASFYTFHHAELPSLHVEDTYAKKLLEMQATELYRFLHSSDGDATIAGFRGVLYERAIVVPRIVHGAGRLELQRLSPVSAAASPALLTQSALDLSASMPAVYFRSVPELQASWGMHITALFVPLSKQFPVVDAVLRIDGQPLLLNATVSDRHDIKVDNVRFRELLQAVGLLSESGVEIPFVWVLPQEAYDRFVTPGVLKTASDKIVGSRHTIGKRLAQYKLLLPVPSSRKVARSKKSK